MMMMLMTRVQKNADGHAEDDDDVDDDAHADAMHFMKVATEVQPR